MLNMSGCEGFRLIGMRIWACPLPACVRKQAGPLPSLLAVRLGPFGTGKPNKLILFLEFSFALVLALALALSHVFHNPGSLPACAAGKAHAGGYESTCL